MLTTKIQAGLYIDTQSCRILRVTRESDLRERPANWELLADDPDTSLLTARQLAMEGGYTLDSREVDWARMYEGSLKNMETLDALDKARRLADQADELAATNRSAFDLFKRTISQAPAGLLAAVAAATLLAAEMAGYTSFA